MRDGIVNPDRGKVRGPCPADTLAHIPYHPYPPFPHGSPEVLSTMLIRSVSSGRACQQDRIGRSSYWAEALLIGFSPRPHGGRRPGPRLAQQVSRLRAAAAMAGARSAGGKAWR